MSRRHRLSRITFIVLAMAVTMAVVLKGATDPRGTEITRYRNAFLIQPGSNADFEWTPSSIPADYLQERASIPEELANWHGFARTGDTLTRSVAIARGLSIKPRRGDPIQQSTVVTLDTIETVGTGYCADYTRVFSALAYAAGIPVREWAFSFDGFGGHGHIFNEVWDRENKRWLMIDVFHGFYPRDAQIGTPLSALEFRRRLTSAPDTIGWERLTPSHFAFKTDAEALDYYRRGTPEWYLWWGSNPLSYDQQPLVAGASQLGHLPEQVAAILTGTLPKFKVLMTEQNRRAFERLIWLKYRLLTAAALEVFLAVMLLWNLAGWFRESAFRSQLRFNVSTEPKDPQASPTSGSSLKRSHR